MHKGFVFRKAECIKPLCVVEKRCVGHLQQATGPRVWAIPNQAGM